VEGFRFAHRLRVRYSEIDGQKIVFNAHYLTYLDITITEYLRDGLKLDLIGLAERGQFDIVLAKTTLEFKRPAMLDDWLTIWCRTAKIGNSSVTIEFAITRDGEESPLLTAETVYVSYNAIIHQSQPVPDFVRARIRQYEEGTTSTV
jgi:acyl-CoA thioester hydrolase